MSQGLIRKLSIGLVDPLLDVCQHATGISITKAKDDLRLCESLYSFRCSRLRVEVYDLDARKAFRWSSFTA